MMNFFNFRCIQCRGNLHIAKNGLCSCCQKQIKSFPYCGHCGAELQYYAQHCGNCLKQEPSWDKIVIIGHYIEPLSILIHRFKFQNQFWIDRTLARLLYLAVRDAKRTHHLKLPEAIIPVPLYHFRQWRRGYNQADLLSQQLSRWLGIPNLNNIVKRVKHTHTQRGLSAKDRRQNLKNAFSLVVSKNEFPYRRVALVDDVITTGSTLNEISKLLRKLDVEEIQVWGLARA